MTIDKFKMWKVAALKDFLSKKGLNSSKNCHDCACLLININEASPWTGNMLVVFILNQLCKTAHLQTLYICKQIPISLHKTENFCESGFQMRAIIQFTDFNTQSCPKIRLCGWVKANHWTLVFILGVISPCTTGLKALYNPSDCTSTVQLSRY